MADAPKLADDYYKVWGHGRSWVVHRVNFLGEITWASHWMNSKDEAETYLSGLRY